MASWVGGVGEIVGGTVWFSSFWFRGPWCFFHRKWERSISICLISWGGMEMNWEKYQNSEVRKLVSMQILSRWFLRKSVRIPPIRVLNLLHLVRQNSSSSKLSPMGKPNPMM